MIKTDTNHLFELQDDDFIKGNDLWILHLPPHIQFSIIQNHQLIIPEKIYCNNQEKIVYLNKLNENSPSPYFLAVHIPKQGMKGNKTYEALNQIQFISKLLSTKNTLLNKNIRPRKQNNNQIIDVPLPEDDSYIFIKIANHIAYSNNINDHLVLPAYLPKYNKNLQKITIRIKADTTDKWDNEILSPPTYINLLLYNPDTNNPYIQIKSKVQEMNWSQQQNNYLNDYGYEYGLFNINDNNGFIWRSSNNIFDMNMEYTFEWLLTEENMNVLINAQNQNKLIMFKCRYAIESYNDNPVWRNFITNPIQIIINTPPPAPINLRMEKRI